MNLAGLGSNRRALVAGGAAVVAAMTIGGVAVARSSSAPEAPPQTLKGTLDLVDDDAFSDSWCYGYGGYSDIAEGARVTVSDSSGKVLGTGQLSQGRGAQTPADISIGRGRSGERYSICKFEFSVTVPRADSYSVQVADRGAQTFSATDTIAFTLGSQY